MSNFYKLEYPNNSNLSLYSDYNKSTSNKTLGFKNKEKAIYTINAIKNKSIKYQISVINTMLGRAKNHPHKTKEMDEAIKVYNEFYYEYNNNPTNINDVSNFYSKNKDEIVNKFGVETEHPHEIFAYLISKKLLTKN